jgi:phospholipid/cholesterol/gamma-HCH transport system substrate-binding protein
MANPRSIEVKVGLLILIAIGILTAFIVLMGGMSFQPTYRVFVDFDNPGGIQSGAPVRMAGVTVGKIKSIEFRGGAEPDPDGKRPALVRLALAIETRHREAVRENATFYVTSQGVLGEQFLAIDPGTRDRPVMADDTVVRGLDPPRLDLLLAEGYELLHTTITAMRANRSQIDEMFKGLHSTLTGTGEFFDKNKDRLTRIAENVETITIETNELVRAGRTRYVDGPQVTRIINNIDHASAAIARDSEPLLRDARTTMENVNRVSATVGAPEEQQKIKQTIQDVSEIANRAKLAAADAQAIVAHIKKGKGSVGSLVMDEQVYDDLQEMVRDLKHNPWKFFWRE